MAELYAHVMVNLRALDRRECTEHGKRSRERLELPNNRQRRSDVPTSRQAQRPHCIQFGAHKRESSSAKLSMRVHLVSHVRD